jgi:hypothetical protein
MFPDRNAPAEGAFPPPCCATYARLMGQEEPDWVAYGTSAAGQILFGHAADPNVCPNCGRAVNACDVVPGSLAIGDQPSEIARCKTPECSASLARIIRTDGSRGAWSAVVATNAE